MITYGLKCHQDELQRTQACGKITIPHAQPRVQFPNAESEACPCQVMNTHGQTLEHGPGLGKSTKLLLSTSRATEALQNINSLIRTTFQASEAKYLS